jgi:hypothetical protein
MKKNNPPKRKSIIDDEKKFAEQWKEVVKKCPIVAVRYLQLLEILIEQWQKSNDFYKEVFNKTNLFKPNSPIKASGKFHKLVSALNEFQIKDPPRCRPAINVDDIERLVNCINKRIAIMTS